jgi:NTP pyrophosphatase (non-canonical NTP hydrolase)
MEIKQAQALLRKLLKEIQHPRLAAFIALSEEVGEVADAVMKYEVYEEHQQLDHLQGELADVLICLLELANVYDIDLEAALQKKLEGLPARITQWTQQLQGLLDKKRKQWD